MSGAAIADAAGLGSVLVPAMKKRGYDEKFALGLTGASSLMGPIIPPVFQQLFMRFRQVFLSVRCFSLESFQHWF